MSGLFRRLLFTAALMGVAVAAASAGVLAWRAISPPPIVALERAPPSVPVSSVPEGLAVGDLRPDFTLPDTGGVQRSVSEWDGKLLVLNFWATWCPPCLEEIPGFVRLQRAYGDRGVQFVGVALDSASNVRRFAAEQAMNYPSLHGQREAIALSRAYGNTLGALPYTVVVGRDRRVVELHQGVLHEDAARALIEKLL